MFAKLENQTGYPKTNKESILNPFVNFHEHANTQSLFDVLVAESIQMRGVECYYIPRELNNVDLLFGEDIESKFNKAYKFAAYLDSFEAYSGANTFYSKFGMSVNDEVTISINPNLFKYQTSGLTTKEGDLIYFPMDKSLFEITWVEPYSPFYQAGKNAIQKITAQKFVYSGEEIKPQLQNHEFIQLDEFDELDLQPVRALDDIVDIQYENQFAEQKQIQLEGNEYLNPCDIEYRNVDVDKFFETYKP